MISFTKATATGNDFLFFDARDQGFDSRLLLSLQVSTRSEAVQKLCNRHFAIGADGVVFLQEPLQSGADLSWDFYNSDGSHAEMCGNAARAFTLVAAQLGFQSPLRFTTAAGLIEGKILGPSLVEVSMTPPRIIERDRRLSQEVEADVIDSGVPHIVVPVKELLFSDEITQLARELRSHSSLGEAGANVTFRAQLSPAKLQSVTFERGVEDFTLACGTGAVAAALSQAHRESAIQEFQVQVPGGLLEVVLDAHRTTAKLRGPAQILFTGQFAQGSI